MKRLEYHYQNVDGRTYMKPAKNRRIKKSLAEMDRTVKKSKAAI